MNAENFHKYLKNPSALYQISYQELKSLVLQYPYSPNLRYLLLVKSLLDNHKDYDRNLSLAAVHSIDRAKLFKQIKSFEKHRPQDENYTLKEDFLELKDLSALDAIVDNLATQQQGGALKQQAINPEEELLDIGGLFPTEDQGAKSFFGDDEVDMGLLENILTDAGPGETEDNQEPAPSDFIEEDIDTQVLEAEGVAMEAVEVPVLEDLEEGPAAREEQTGELPGSLEEMETVGKIETALPAISGDIHEIVASASALIAAMADDGQKIMEATAGPTIENEPSKNIPFEITNEAGRREEVPQPIPKESFNSWLRQFKPPKVGILEADFREVVHEAAEVEEEAPKPGLKVKELAAKSIAVDTGLASQSLAALLEAQGHYEKAIAMYERLSLQYPRKSSLFAAKIDDLKSKL